MYKLGRAEWRSSYKSTLGPTRLDEAGANEECGRGQPPITFLEGGRGEGGKEAMVSAFLSSSEKEEGGYDPWPALSTTKVGKWPWSQPF